MKKIHCFGAVVVDLLNGPIREYPVPRFKTQVTAAWIRIMPGGGAANAPSALARMGLGVSTFSKVGGDLYGEFICRELQQVGVDTSGIFVSGRDTTAFTFVGVHSDGDRTFIHTPGANVTWCMKEVDIEAVLACGYLLYHDLWVLPRMDGEPARALLAEAQKRGIVTFLDEDFGYGPQLELLEVMLPYCDYVTPSYDDLQSIYPGSSPEELANRLLDQGARAAVIKMGHRGCLVAQGTERIHVPALPACPADTTGAGDCWDAGFIAALAAEEDVVTAARIGNACAAFCIEAVGGATGIPTYAAVRQRAVQTSRTDEKPA